MSDPTDQPTLPPASPPEAATLPPAAPPEGVTLPPAAPAEQATLPPPAQEGATLAPSASPAGGGDARAPAGYEIEKELGRGGMGVVYKARSLALQRPCALKMILSGAHSGSDEIARFRSEAQAIARLQHPGIVQVFEIGEHDGRPFMALEFCGGGSLDGKLAKSPLAPRDAAKLVKALAEAIHAAHEARVLHRDLKPANVLLTDRGEPKVTDFGLAKKLDEDGATRTGSVMGTPSYMPPEQAEGRKDVGPAADTYALGAVLYECLASRPPFRAATALDTILQVLADEPVAVRQLNPRAPVDLETVAHKCLQKDPAKRYATAQELADDLGRYLAGEPIKARPVGAVERGVKWVRRNAVVSALAAAVLLALTAGVAVSGYFAVAAGEEARAARKAEADARDEKVRADDKADVAAKAEAKALEAKTEAEKREKAEAAAKALALAETKRAEGEKARAEEQLRRAEWLVYAGKLSQAQSAFAENNFAVAWQRLDECQWDLRGWEHAHLRWRFDSSKLTLKGHTREVLSVSFSPDGGRLLTGSQDGTATVWDAAKGTQVITIKGHTQPVSSVSFSPDGQRILTGSRDNTAKVWDANKGTQDLTLQGASGPVAFSPDGRRILTGSGLKAKVWDAAKGTEVLTLNGHTREVWSVSFSPDGRRILTGSLDKTAKVWDAEKGTEVLILKGHTSEVASVSFSPDGRRILTGSWDSTAKVWDAEKGTEVLTLKGHRANVVSVAFSPNGQRVFAWDAAGKVLAWSAEGGKPVAAANPPARPAPGAARSPDGRLAAKPDGAVVSVVDLLRPAAQVGSPWPLPDAAQRKAYHGEQALAAEKAGQPFAAAFHLGRLLLDAPADAGLKQRREQALKRHAETTPNDAPRQDKDR